MRWRRDGCGWERTRWSGSWWTKLAASTRRSPRRGVAPAFPRERRSGSSSIGGPGRGCWSAWRARRWLRCGRAPRTCRTPTPSTIWRMPTSTNKESRSAGRRRGAPPASARVTAPVAGGGGDPAAARACAGLWLTLVALALARAVLPFAHSMWAWSLNLPRFMAPALGWTLWAVAALALVPPLARALSPACAALGESMATRPVRLMLGLAAGAAALVLIFPDRLWFVGDFLLRQYTLEDRPTAISTWYPYALPLDLFLHDTVARVLMQRMGFLANDTGRLLGAIEAALLAATCVGFARALKARGAGAVAAAGVAFWGGYLTMLTGYNKAFSELPLIMAAAATTALALVKDGGSPFPFALVLAVGFVLHRSALGLLPLAIVTLVLWARAHPGAWRRPTSLAALALPLVTLAIMLPRIVRIVTRIDPMHFAPDEVRQAGGILPGLFLGTRLVDLLNVVIMLSPLALAAPALAARLGRSLASSSAGRSEGLVLAALALPFVLTMPFIHPGQGYYRDWDDFAAAGMTLSLLTAWLVTRAVERSPQYAWLAVAALLGAAAPSLQWLIHQSDVNRGLDRIDAFLSEPPPRTESERARAWDYLGWRLTDLGQFDGAAAAFGRLAEVQPSPRVMRQWATTEALRGNLARAQEIYRQMLTRFPNVRAGWYELARPSYQMGDLDEARRAAGEMLRLAPDDAGTQALIAHLDSLRSAHGH